MPPKKATKVTPRQLPGDDPRNPAAWHEGIRTRPKFAGFQPPSEAPQAKLRLPAGDFDSSPVAMWECIVGGLIHEVILPQTNARLRRKRQSLLTEEDVRRYFIFLDVARVDPKPELKHYFVGSRNRLHFWLGCEYARLVMEGVSLPRGP